jgi:hypothetical protein
VQTEPHPGKIHLTRRIQQSAVAPDSDAGKRFDQVAAAVFPDASAA